MNRVFVVLTLLIAWLPAAAQEAKSDVQTLIPWLLEEDRALEGIAFSEVALATSGKRVIPIVSTNEADQRLLRRIGNVIDAVLKQMNAPESAAQRERRINEVSGHFEKALLKAFNESPGFACDWPKNAVGKIQRAGYPDLRLEDKATGRVIYLDPKLYEQRNRASSLRTFYFEPKRETNKILEDAHHLLIGIAHDGKQEGHWKFLDWEIVDLSRFRVRLKAEFQGSNRDLYREENVVATSRAEK